MKFFILMSFLLFNFSAFSDPLISVVENALINQNKELTDFLIQEEFSEEIKKEDPDQLKDLMELFIKYNYKKGVEYLLKNTELSLIKEPKSPIGLALDYDNKEVADLFLKTGLLVEMYEHPERSVRLMQKFINHAYFSGLDYVLKNGFNANERNEKKETIAHFIAKSKLKDQLKIEKLQYLHFTHKLDLYERDYDGKTCFDYMNVLSGLTLRYKTKDLFRSRERLKMLELKNPVSRKLLKHVKK